jgi:sulfatase modifying factor 1
MKTVIWASLIFFSCSAWGQPEISEKFLKQINLKKIDSPNSYLFKYEVSNFAYQEMLYYAAQKDSSIYFQMLPDTTVWNTSLGSNEKFVSYYFQHPAYRDYPVVGVSHEQAQLYCDMLTDIFNSKILLNNSEIEEVVFRLPSENEWEAAARAGHPFAVYPWKEESVRHHKTGQLLANFVRSDGDYMGVAGQLNDGLDVTAPIESYWPNELGLYNMSGNVAEMLAEKGIAKGGGWIHGASNLRIDSAVQYHKSECWLGFRYVMEVVKYRPQPMKKLEIDAHYLEGMMVRIDSLTLNKSGVKFAEYTRSSFNPYYISKIETPLSWYNAFLEDIRTSDPSKFGSCYPDDSLWRSVTDVLNYYSYSEQAHFKNYPVVNINELAANHFCEWLTSIYNRDPKRKHQEVIFKLPSAQEWKRVNEPYNNFGENIWRKMEKGTWHYAVNYHPLDEMYYGIVSDENGKTYRDYFYPDGDENSTRGLDGYEVLAPVDAFEPNALGLYNCFGNAAELIDDDYFILGGSWMSHWNDYDYQSDFLYTPSPQVGFRVVMHVVEE